MLRKIIAELLQGVHDKLDQLLARPVPTTVIQLTDDDVKRIAEEVAKALAADQTPAA